jgi:uncharacterized RDD family membrane protein YckC
VAGMDARLDTLRTVETPEGVWLELRVAGPIARALAFGIDTLIRITIYMVVGSSLAQLGEAGTGVLMLLVFVVEWFYPVLFEVLWDGQTPGKRALSLAVVHSDGRPVGWSASLLRNLMLFADFLPAGYLLGLGSMIASDDFRRLGDHAAGTVVTYRDAPRALPAPDDSTPPRAPRAPLTADEQRALLGYAARSSRWSAERQDELLGCLSDVISEPEPSSVVAGAAAWLRGLR